VHRSGDQREGGTGKKKRKPNPSRQGYKSFKKANGSGERNREEAVINLRICKDSRAATNGAEGGVIEIGEKKKSRLNRGNKSDNKKRGRRKRSQSSEA